MSLPILTDLVHNLRCYTEFCSQFNDRVLSLVFLLSANQLVPHEIHQVTFKTISMTVVRSGGEADYLF
jgi:hypothetical protein